MTILSINPFLLISLIVLLVLIGVMIALYFWGKKLEKRNAENEAAMESAAQTYSILIIDKKKLKMKDANLPKIVLESTPKYLRRSKVPIIKAKIGPKVTNLISAPELFDRLPVKTELKVVISGIYIKSCNSNKLLPPPKKKTLKQKLMNKLKK